jgi:hypothetical protein
MIYNNLNINLLDLYFLKLNFNERRYFLDNFHDYTFKEDLRRHTDLFNQYPFHDKEIKYFCREYYRNFDQKTVASPITLITKWQKSYYISIYQEYHSRVSNNLDYQFTNIEIQEIYKNLEIKNTSFKFLINLMREIEQSPDSEGSTEILSNIFSYNVISDILKDDTSKNDQNSYFGKSQLDKDIQDQIEQLAAQLLSNLKDRG